MAFPILGTPKPQFFDSSGSPLTSGTLSVLDPADDTNKASYPTYDDAEGATNANSNPITLDSRGECDLWGLDNEDYKLVLKDSSGTTIWTSDDVFVPIRSAASIGKNLYAQTSAELSAGVTPTAYQYEPGDVRRYGPAADGSTDDATPLSNMLAANSGGRVWLEPGKTYVSTTALVNDCDFDLNGATLKFTPTGAVKCLDMRSNSSVYNGTIQNVGTSPSSSGDYQCPIIIGNYGAGTGYENVRCYNLTITNNRSNGNGIMVTGDSSSIEIRNIKFSDSSTLGRPILIHWGGATTPASGTTHPNDVSIEGIKCGDMTSATSDGACIFLSSVYNIKVKNVYVEDYDWEALITVFAGDYGAFYAPDNLKSKIMRGIEISQVGGVTNRAASNGFKVDGLSTLAPVNPSTPAPTFRDCWVRGSGAGSTDNGVIPKDCFGLVLDNCSISGFLNGVATSQAVSNMRIIGGEYFHNQARGIQISNGTTPPTQCIVDGVHAHSNTLDSTQDGNIYIGQSTDCSVINSVVGQDSITDTFVDGDVNTGTDRITLTGHGFEHLSAVELTTTGTLPAGLATGTGYYVKVIDANTIELYSDIALSSIVDITAAAGGGTHTITTKEADWGIRVDTTAVDAVINDNYCRNAETVAYSIGSSTTYGLTKSFQNNTAASGITEHGGMTPQIISTHVRSSTVIRECIGTAAPASGTWVAGDRVYDETPSAGGTIGWVCTTGGTPGTWKTFGSIAA